MKRNRYREKKKAVQRSYPEDEMWNLEHTIASFIAPRLEEFIKYYAPLATPESIIDKYGSERGNLEWLRILRKMKYSFDCLSTPAGIRRDDEELDKVQEGLDLFARYFRSLWY